MDTQELFLKLKNEIKTQLETQTKIITENLNANLDEKLQPILEENKLLKTQVEDLTNKVYYLEREARKDNLILHGIKEDKENNEDLMGLTLKILNDVSEKAKIEGWDRWEISMVRRLGWRTEGRNRPILMSLTLNWRKIEILKNNKSFPEGIYATEDLPKEVINKRKELRKIVEEEKIKGNIAFIRYDKIVIIDPKKGKQSYKTDKIRKEDTNQAEKRKRTTTKSPNTEHSPDPKLNKIIDFRRVRTRSFSSTEKPNF